MIRPAQQKDIDSIQQLYEALFREMHALQPAYFSEARQDEKFLTDAVNDDDKLLLVVEADSVIEGFVLALLQDTLPYNCLVKHSYVYLTDVVVSPHSRGKGFGKKLLDAVKQWGREKKAHHIELNVLEENHLARKLYLREEFTTSSITMRFEL